MLAVKILCFIRIYMNSIIILIGYPPDSHKSQGYCIEMQGAVIQKQTWSGVLPFLLSVCDHSDSEIEQPLNL